MCHEMKGVSFFVILDTLVGRYYAGNYHLFVSWATK